jgi:hypothetical protein
MAKFVEFSTNFDTFDTFEKFKREFEVEIIQYGLDEPLKESLDKLKTSLKFLINEKTLSKPDQQVSQDVPVTSATELNQTKTTMPKSDAEIIKHLTQGKVDPTKHNKNKEYTTPHETNLVFGNKNKHGEINTRVALRQEITSDESVESQFSKAKAFFNKTMFALPDRSGKVQYYANPGIDLSADVKIKCSTQTGDGNADPKRGLSPAERFKRDSKNKEDENGRHFSEWTLKQAAVTRIQASFINITPVVDAVKDGDFDRAVTIAKIQDKSGKLPEVVKQTAQLPDGPAVAESTRNYTNLLKLVNNLTQIKKSSYTQVVYSLVSDYTASREDKIYIDEVKLAIRNWVTENEEQWFNAFVKKVENLIKKYESKP